MSLFENLQGGFHPPCKKRQGGFYPSCKNHEGDYIHLYKNDQGGFCPGGGGDFVLHSNN